MSFEDNSANKRTRASGEVLDYLLQEFELNQNPSPEQRKEISDRTNMSEKAVRIWFQNRRAKLRKLERMGQHSNSGQGGTTSLIHSSRSNSFSMIERPNMYNFNSSFNISNHIPIEINEKYCLVDCLSLSVGSWQRIKTGYHDENLLKSTLVNLSPFNLNTVMNNVDLLVILSKKNLELNYFFLAISNNVKILFRIFYPIQSIITCLLLDNNINKENNELRVSLSSQPKFSVFFFNGTNSEANQWSICDDFSEGQQVLLAYSAEGGTSIPHVLVGVKNSLQFLNAFILENNQLGRQQYPIYSQQPQQQQQSHSNANPSHSEDNVFEIPVSTPFIHLDDASGAPIEDYQYKNDTAMWDENKLNGFSPLDGLESEHSPHSMTSNNSNTSSMHHIGPLVPGSEPKPIHNHLNKHRGHIPNGDHKSHLNGNSTNNSSTKNNNNNNNNINTPANPSAVIKNHPNGGSGSDEYTVNTPDFFGGAQTPGLASSLVHHEPVVSNNSLTEHLIHSPSTNLQSYTHQSHSPFTTGETVVKLEIDGNHIEAHHSNDDHEMVHEAEAAFMDLHGMDESEHNIAENNDVQRGGIDTKSSLAGGTGAHTNQTPQTQQDFEFSLTNEFLTSQTPGSETNNSNAHGHHVDSYIDYNSHYP